MRLEFQLTPDDFAEAEAARVRALQGMRGERSSEGEQRGGSTAPFVKPKFLRGLYGWTFIILLSVLFFLLMIRHRPSPGTQAPPDLGLQLRTGASNLPLAVLPPLVGAAFLFALVSWMLGSNTTRSGIPFYVSLSKGDVRRRILARTLSALSLILGITGVVVLWQIPLTPAQRADRIPLLLIPLGIWLAFCFAMIRLARMTWSARPDDSDDRTTFKPHTAEIDENGVRITHAMGELWLTWPYIASYLESPNVMILYTRDRAVQLLPKRALKDPAELIALRGLIQSHVEFGQFLESPSAFPVLTRA